MDGAFTVTPTSQKISLEPGASYTGSVFVINPADATNDFNYIVEVTPYGVVGELYDADFATQTDHTQLSKWITILNPTGAVAPNQSTSVNFTIDVPTDAPAGGQYAAIAIRSNDEIAADGIAVQNVFEIASLIYANVAGETVKSGQILDNFIPGLAFNPPVTLSATLNNSGNVHQDAIIKITVKNNFTGEVIYPKDNDAKSFNEVIMPGTTRLATRDISNMPGLGIFHVSQEITYNGQTSLAEKDLVICPLWFFILVIVTLAAAIYSIASSIIKRRHRTQP